MSLTKSFASAFSLIVLCFSVSAQQTAFQLDISASGFDNITAVTENAAGNFILASETFNGTGSDIIMVEVSPAGTVLQSQAISLPENEFARSVFETSDGHYIVTGAISITSNNFDWFVLKLDNAFNLVWYNTYTSTGNDYANNGFEISPGHYCITGTVALGGSAKPAVVTIDSAGAVINEGYLTTNQFASPRYKGYYMGDGVIAFAQMANAISLLDTSGNVLQNYNFAFGTYSTNIIRTNDGGYAIASLSGLGAPTGAKMALSVLDSSLSTVAWSVQFGVNGNNITPIGLEQDTQGNFWVAATVESFISGTYKPIVVKVDGQGNLLWSNEYSPTGVADPQFNAMIKTSDDGFLLVGQMSTALQRMFVAKLDSTGSSSCNVTPFPLSPQPNTPISRTPHAPFTGAIIASGPSAPTTTNPAAMGNIYCITTGIDEVSDQNQFVVSPTMVVDGFNVSFNHPAKAAELMVMDMNGKLVLSKTITDNQYVDCSRLKTGTYVIRIRLKDSEKLFSQPFIKTSSK